MDCSIGLVDSVIYLQLPNGQANFPGKNRKEIQIFTEVL